MALTAKQEAFCQAIAGGSTQADAYRLAYDAENMAMGSIHDEASRLTKNPGVAHRISELKEELACKLLWTRKDSMQVMVDIAQGEALDKDKVAAVKVLNDMCGFNAPIKQEVNSTVTNRTLDSFYGEPESGA